jgi:hypothetical protein
MINIAKEIESKKEGQHAIKFMVGDCSGSLKIL